MRSVPKGVWFGVTEMCALAHFHSGYSQEFSDWCSFANSLRLGESQTYFLNPPITTPEIDLPNKSTIPDQPVGGFWGDANSYRIPHENVVGNVLISESNIGPCTMQFIWGSQWFTMMGLTMGMVGAGWPSWNASTPTEELFMTPQLYVWWGWNFVGKIFGKSLDIYPGSDISSSTSTVKHEVTGFER